MYKAGGYFFECFLEPVNDHGWRCTVRFSRIKDYGPDATTATIVCPAVMATGAAAEYAAVLWARRYVQLHGDEIELALTRKTG
ncbi:hypothetical protein [Caballeronia sp. LZ001]|uniref:hypothetical protein n=1 Tax=Caballeronia sp. LZ001 TaxID=3038553 RepID=UPI002861C17B|nr:hypothetical protein [Caballeronia sp. LZ001]MDR5801600.1 hypothetical protein [Caballeronia sp. LZ001]